MLLNSCLINSQRRPWILLFLNKLWKQSFFTEVYSTKCRKRWFRLTIIITQHKIFFREWKIQLLRKKLFWAIFTTLCLDILLKIFYHYWHKKTSKKTVEQYKSDQTFALMIQNAECLVFRNLENIVLNSSGCYTRWDISIIYSTVFYFFT